MAEYSVAPCPVPDELARLGGGADACPCPAEAGILLARRVCAYPVGALLRTLRGRGMTRTLIGWLLLGIVAASCGCAMCASPFDYCGPTYDDGVDSCCPRARAGSILAGTAEPAAVVGPEPYQGPAYIDALRRSARADARCLSSEPRLPAADEHAAPGGHANTDGHAIAAEHAAPDDHAAAASERPVAGDRPAAANEGPATGDRSAADKPPTAIERTADAGAGTVGRLGDRPERPLPHQGGAGSRWGGPLGHRPLVGRGAGRAAQTAAAKAAASDAATASTTPAAPVTLTDVAPAIAIASGETSVKLAENTPRRASGWSPRR